MATNDLMVELQKDSIKLDDDSERKVIFICRVCLNQEYSDILGQFGSCKILVECLPNSFELRAQTY